MSESHKHTRIKKFVGQFNHEIETVAGGERYMQPINEAGTRWIISVVARESITEAGEIIDPQSLDAASQTSLYLLSSKSAQQVAGNSRSGVPRERLHLYADSNLKRAVQITARNGAEIMSEHLSERPVNDAFFVNDLENERLKFLSVKDVIHDRFESGKMTNNEAVSYLAVFDLLEGKNIAPELLERAKLEGSRVLEAKIVAAAREPSAEHRVDAQYLQRVVGQRKGGIPGISIEEVVKKVKASSPIVLEEAVIRGKIADELARVLDYMPLARYRF